LNYDDLAMPAYDRDISVTSNTDISAPDLLQLALAPKRVDTRKAARNVVITARARDIQSAGLGAAQLRAEDGNGHSAFASLTRVKGHKNLLRGRMFIARWQGSGRWHMASASIYDRVGNSQNYSRADLASIGDHSFRVIGRSDHAKPRISGFHMSTRHIDVRKKATTVAFRARVRDARAGVVFAYVSITGKNDTGTLKGLRPTGSNPHNVVFKGALRIRPCGGLRGAFTVKVVAVDAPNNHKTLKHGTLTVRAKDRTTPRASMTAFAQNPVSVKVNFNEAVDGISESSVIVTLAAEHAPSIPFSPPVCYAGEDLSGGTVDCLTGRVRSADLHPIAALTPSTDYYVIINPEGVLDVTDFGGNPFQQTRLLFEAET
jgi:hypothetical protein